MNGSSKIAPFSNRYVLKGSYVEWLILQTVKKRSGRVVNQILHARDYSSRNSIPFRIRHLRFSSIFATPLSHNPSFDTLKITTCNLTINVRLPPIRNFLSKQGSYMEYSSDADQYLLDPDSITTDLAIINWEFVLIEGSLPFVSFIF